MAKLTKDKRIKAENDRLREFYEDLPEDSLDLAIGLIDRAAFLRPTLEDLEQDINDKGTTHLFSQGQETPYERERPIVRQYNQLLNNYQKILKQLDDFRPPESSAGVYDGFDDFIRK